MEKFLGKNKEINMSIFLLICLFFLLTKKLINVLIKLLKYIYKGEYKMGWETSHRKRNIDQVDLEGIDRDRRRILSGYGTSQNSYSKETPEEDLTSVRDILGEMPEEMDDDIMKAIETIDEEVTPQERRDMLETTKDVREMSEEELDYDFNADLEEVMRH